MFCQLSSAALSVVQTEGLSAAIDRFDELLAMYAHDSRISAMIELILDRLHQMQPVPVPVPAPEFNHANWIVNRAFKISKRVAR